MTPKIADIQTWQQAELLMQPAFIRLIDNIRKQLDQSTWKGTYQDVQIWAEGVPDEVKSTVARLQEQLREATPEQAIEIEAALANLPSPHPGYLLCLQQGDRQINVDLWDVCYQICFQEYTGTDRQNQPVAIDASLIDETGDIDWHHLDVKTQQLVEQIFKQLPE